MHSLSTTVWSHHRAYLPKCSVWPGTHVRRSRPSNSTVIRIRGLGWPRPKQRSRILRQALHDALDSLVCGRRAVEADLGAGACPYLDLPRQATSVALQSAVGDVHDQVPGREGPAGGVAGDAGSQGLPPCSRRAGATRTCPHPYRGNRLPGATPSGLILTSAVAGFYRPLTARGALNRIGNLSRLCASLRCDCSHASVAAQGIGRASTGIGFHPG